MRVKIISKKTNSEVKEALTFLADQTGGGPVLEVPLLLVLSEPKAWLLKGTCLDPIYEYKCQIHAKIEF